MYQVNGETNSSELFPGTIMEVWWSRLSATTLLV